jgi:hypothetical protein
MRRSFMNPETALGVLTKPCPPFFGPTSPSFVVLVTSLLCLFKLGAVDGRSLRRMPMPNFDDEELELRCCGVCIGAYGETIDDR